MNTQTSPCRQVTWTESLKLSFESRNRRERIYDGIIDDYKRLAIRAARLTERNNALIASAALVNEGDKDSAIAALAAASRPSLPLSDHEGKISSLREELTDLYRTQSQNAQRLVILNDQLRKSEDQSRRDSEELKRLQESHGVLRVQTTDLENLIKEKNQQIQLLQDELGMLNLEMIHMEERSKKLEEENRELIARWNKMKETEVERMNEMNELLEASRKRVDNE